MSFFSRLALLIFLVAAAAPDARAQSTEIFNGATLSLNGLNLTVSGCTLSTATLSACGNSDGIFLQNVNTGRGTVTYEVIGASGGPVFSLAAGSNVTDTLTFTLTVTTNQLNSKIGSGDLTLNGATSPSGTHHVRATQSFAANSPSPAPTGLTSDSLFLANSATTRTTGIDAFTNSPLLSSFKVTNVLSATPSAGSTVRLSSLVETFRTVPEPASISLLMLALGGLAFARRRAL